jgi:hypothetical protein
VDGQSHAAHLLRELGLDGQPPRGDDPSNAWAASGGMALTGLPEGPVLTCPGPAVALEGALLALRTLAPDRVLPDVRLLGERAACAGLSRQGSTSCGRKTKLLAARDGWVAVALARAEDHELVPALVEDDVVPGREWEAVARWVASSSTSAARERARLLGLPVAVLGEEPATVTPWVVQRVGAGREVRGRPRVVDLSALWAGPLCASLLGLLGCDVLKVEDPRRPDGARGGPARFFDLLHAGAKSVPLDLSGADGRRRLLDLVLAADVVIESSRPRALDQLGVVAEEVVAEAGVTWVSITAHGRDQPDRVGYGDDAAVAGGLVAWTVGRPVFVADAVADPLTGAYAALAAWAGVLNGGGMLVDMSLSRAAAVAASTVRQGPDAVACEGGWCVSTDRGHVGVAAPWARPAMGRAPALRRPR